MFKEEPDLIDLPVLTKVEQEEIPKSKKFFGKMIDDKVFYAKIGMNGILDDVSEILEGKYDLELELNSQFKKSLVEFSFLKIKAAEQAVFGNTLKDFNQTDMYNGAFQFPQKFFFKFKFFDFEETKTGPITYEHSNNQQPKDLLEGDNPYHLLYKDITRKEKEKEVSAKYKFTFDPSIYNEDFNIQMTFREEFIKYLHTKVLEVEIYNYDS